MALQRALRARARFALHVGAPGHLPLDVQLRLGVLCLVFLAAAGLLVSRLYVFQVQDVARYKRLADEERRASIPIIPSRGALLDTTGSPLAVSVRYDSVYVLGALVGGDRSEEHT